MRLAVLCMCGTLLAISMTPGNYANPSEGTFQWGTESGSCLVTLKPAGKCGGEGIEEDACPYRFILPPLDIMLPWQLRELERTVKEVQRLKETVEQLKRACMECKMSQRERERERLGDR
ncbi:fibroleukin-like, partial [Coregonus clupeaformis]|uniref:fibroleukin-like n=1 Tax=Coregonus clupeaformis TaxID=59861 RepID=UPI001BE0EEBF